MAKRREKGTGNVRPDTSRPGNWVQTKEGTKTWRGSWVGTIQVDGRRYTVRGKNKTETSAKLAKKKASALTDTGYAAVDRRLTVAQVVDRYIERDLPNRRTGGKPLAPGTVQNWRNNADLTKREIGKKRLAQLTYRDVERMYDRLAERDDRPLGKAALRKLHSMFRLMIEAAKKRGDVSRNVVDDAAVTPTATETQPRKALEPDDARRLLDTLRHGDVRLGAMFALGLRLGLRPGEAAGLHWDDLSIDEAPFTVNVTRSRRRGQRSVEISDDLKTSGSKRTLEAPADIATWLREHRQAQRVERLASRTWIDDRLVFTTPTGNVVDPKKARTELADACDLAGVPHIRPNELRHSCASLLADMGVPHEHLADLLGHTSTRMVQSTYRHRLRPVVSVAADTDWTTAESG